MLQNPTGHKDDEINICILGPSGVGKSSLVYRLDPKYNHIDLLPPISKTCCASHFTLHTTPRIHLLDLDDDQRFASLHKMYYLKCQVFVLVFDASKMENGLADCHYYIQTIHEERKDHFFYIIFVANKIDLISDKEKIILDNMLKQFAKMINEDLETYNSIYGTALTSAIANHGTRKLLGQIIKAGQQILREGGEFAKIKLNLIPSNLFEFDKKNYRRSCETPSTPLTLFFRDKYKEELSEKRPAKKDHAGFLKKYMETHINPLQPPTDAVSPDHPPILHPHR